RLEHVVVEHVFVRVGLEGHGRLGEELALERLDAHAAGGGGGGEKQDHEETQQLHRGLTPSCMNISAHAGSAPVAFLPPTHAASAAYSASCARSGAGYAGKMPTPRCSEPPNDA